MNLNGTRLGPPPRPSLVLSLAHCGWGGLGRLRSASGTTRYPPGTLFLPQYVQW